MKQLTTLSLMTFMAIGAAGCGDNEELPPTGGGESSVPADERKKAMEQSLKMQQGAAAEKGVEMALPGEGK